MKKRKKEGMKEKERKEGKTAERMKEITRKII